MVKNMKICHLKKVQQFQKKKKLKHELDLNNLYKNECAISSAVVIHPHGKNSKLQFG